MKSRRYGIICGQNYLQIMHKRVALLQSPVISQIQFSEIPNSPFYISQNCFAYALKGCLTPGKYWHRASNHGTASADWVIGPNEKKWIFDVNLRARDDDYFGFPDLVPFYEQRLVYQWERENQPGHFLRTLQPLTSIFNEEKPQEGGYVICIKYLDFVEGHAMGLKFRGNNWCFMDPAGVEVNRNYNMAYRYAILDSNGQIQVKNDSYLRKIDLLTFIIEDFEKASMPKAVSSLAIIHFKERKNVEFKFYFGD